MTNVIIRAYSISTKTLKSVKTLNERLKKQWYRFWIHEKDDGDR